LPYDAANIRTLIAARTTIAFTPITWFAAIFIHVLGQWVLSLSKGGHSMDFASSDGCSYLSGGCTL
jgi:hypothetical protein